LAYDFGYTDYEAGKYGDPEEEIAILSEDFQRYLEDGAYEREEWWEESS